MKQTKLLKLIIVPFFVVVDLSAEESTDHVSRTSLLKVSQNAGRSILYCIHGTVWQHSLRRSLSRRICLWSTSEVSHVGPLDFLSPFFSAT